MSPGAAVSIWCLPGTKPPFQAETPGDAGSLRESELPVRAEALSLAELGLCRLHRREGGHHLLEVSGIRTVLLLKGGAPGSERRGRRTAWLPLALGCVERKR